MKIESLLTAILVAACCVLLIPYKFTPKRCLFAIIILPIAGIPSGTLIIRTAESNANAASALKILQLLLGKDNIGMDLPYSLLLGAAGILFASFSWMYCIVLFFKLRKIASQAKARRVQNVSSVQGIPLEHIYTTLQRPYYLDAV